ncbi:MAG: type II secretion system F family protein [Edaphobacter sp.]
MGFVILTFLFVFLLVASGGLILFYRQAMIQRISTVIAPRPRQASIRGTLEHTGFTLGSMVEQLERVVPKSKAEMSVIQQRLVRAGYRNDSVVKLFYGAKFAVPALLCILAFVSGVWRYSPFFVYMVALGLGFLLPDFWLGNRMAARQARIRRGLPDVLDLLVICIEAGLSLDQAVARTADELSMGQPDICDELGVVVLEQRAGLPRASAWKNFADRTNVESVRNLCSVLIQSEKFGTSIAKTLRVHSDTLRTQRRQRVEEQAAKTTIKLVFPLVFFIFPSLFLVTLGPAVISVMENFNRYLIH